MNEDTNRIYVANANHTVSVVDGATNTLVKTIPVLQGLAVVNTDDLVGEAATRQANNAIE